MSRENLRKYPWNYLMKLSDATRLFQVPSPWILQLDHSTIFFSNWDRYHASMLRYLNFSIGFFCCFIWYSFNKCFYQSSICCNGPLKVKNVRCFYFIYKNGFIKSEDDMLTLSQQAIVLRQGDCFWLLDKEMGYDKLWVLEVCHDVEFMFLK